MASVLIPKEQGEFKIEHFDISGNEFHALLSGIPSGKYVRLMHNGQVVMSNTPMEIRTNSWFCHHANGDVLIGGLGLGMIVLAIQDNPNIQSITVLEKYKDVIDIVASQLPFNKKVQIIHADVFDWKPDKSKRFDCIYMDIWNYINSDVYNKEMKPLKRKWGHYLKSKSVSPNRFNCCWAEWEAKNNARLI